MYSNALFTDFYELTMAAGYFYQNKGSDTATFEMYFRDNPFEGGYSIAAGLETAVHAVMNCSFGNDDIEFLEEQKTPDGAPLFGREFLNYLASYRFKGDIRGVPEGTVVFPNEPLLQASGNLIECQIIESVLLCHINFQTLIATKAARIWESSGHGSIIEFGLRRSQGPDGALSACRAAYIGGADATSNVLAAARLGIPAKGTHAHSWIQSFDTELDAFRAYAQIFPDTCILLVDTYDTLTSGVPNAITVAGELEKKGRRLSGIRIDSGDLVFLSREARKMLDHASLPDVKIVASNDLDETAIADIMSRGGCVDIWGIGTRLVTGAGKGGSALGGIYKLVEHNGKPKIKLSSNPDKTTNPGFKKIVRFYDTDGLMDSDILADISEDLSSGDVNAIDPKNPSHGEKLHHPHREELLHPVLQAGAIVHAFPVLDQIRDHRKDQLQRLHKNYRRLHNPLEYKVRLSEKLWLQKDRMLNRIDY